MATTLNAGNATSGAAISADTTGVLALQSGSTPTTAVTIDTSQNVGIGTASPVSKLNVNGGAVTLAETTAGLYNLDFQSRTASTNARIQYDQVTNTTGQLLFYTNGGSLTERMRITSAGNLLINTTSQLYNSNSYLNIAYDGAAYYGLTFKATTTGGGSTVNFMNYVGTRVGSISQTDSVTLYNTTSDYRLKEDVVPMVGALGKVALLKPVTYKWKLDGSSSQGFIAHELQAIVPDCVTGKKDAVETVDDVDAEGKVIGTKEVPKYQGIDTSFLVATLTAAIQELNAKVDAQALEIQALKGVA